MCSLGAEWMSPDASTCREKKPDENLTALLSFAPTMSRRKSRPFAWLAGCQASSALTLASSVAYCQAARAVVQQVAAVGGCHRRRAGGAAGSDAGGAGRRAIRSGARHWRSRRSRQASSGARGGARSRRAGSQRFEAGRPAGRAGRGSRARIFGKGANLPAIVNGDPTKVRIDQTQQKAILTWKTFNVGEDTDLAFDQKGNRDWIALNRVLDSTAPSKILGSIKADGQVYVINRNGIIFGGTSQVNVGTLIASLAQPVE